MSHYNMKSKKTPREMNNQTYIHRFRPREYYINTFINHQPLDTCPECGSEIKYSSEDEDETYCTKCGLVTSGSYPYVAGQKIDFPYGIRLKK